MDCIEFHGVTKSRTLMSHFHFPTVLGWGALRQGEFVNPLALWHALWAGRTGTCAQRRPSGKSL